MMTRLLALAAMAFACAMPAMAQQQQEASPQREVQRTAPDDMPMDRLTMADADLIEGAKVRNPAGEILGEVDNLVVSMKDDKIHYAIVDVGDYLGVDDKSVAVPFARLNPAAEPRAFVLDVDRQTLENAPAIDPDRTASLAEPGFERRIAEFWQQADRQQAEMPERQGK